VSSVLAKTMFVVVALLLGTVFAVLYVTSRPPAGAQQVVAEFRNSFPLLEGMHVRVEGAIAGSVGPIEVADDGLARVTLLLNSSIEDATADATAAIRQQDTTGDSYVAFEPGDSDESLPEVDGKPTIECGAEGPTDPCQQTLVAPRFDDLLNAFGPQERAGVELILSQLAAALEERGTDLNEAALELRPALVGANDALAEVNRQNAALRPLIEDMEAVTGQAAARRAELDRLIESLQTTLATTATEAPSLDAGLERLPETVSRTRTTLAALTRASEASTPLAREVAAAAPGLATALELLPGFLDDARGAMTRTEPTLELTRKLLVDATPTILADPQRVVTGAFDLAPAVSNLLTGVFGDENTFKALFGDDSYGFGEGTLDNSGFGAVAVDPGNQLFYPEWNENRNFVRISMVLNCSIFGVPVKPGCLGDLLSMARAGGPDNARDVARETTAQRGGDGPGGDGGSGGEPETAPDPSAPEDRNALEELQDDLNLPQGIDLGGLGDTLDELEEGLRQGLGRGGRGGGSGQSPNAIEDLLDFLMS
jgi:virulence factor Mce-like protein